jgi:hypothetical protein
MKDGIKFIRDSYFNLLEGNITYNGSVIPVYDEEADETGNDFYIIISTLTDAYIPVKTKFFNEVTILIDVVTMFNTRMYANSDPQPKMKEPVDVITGKILDLVKPTRDTTGIADNSDFQVIDVTKESSQHFPILDVDDKKIIRRLTRFSQIVIEK